MIQSVQSLKSQISTLNSLLYKKAQVQKILSSPNLIYFSIRTYQKTISVVVGRGSKFQGLWITDKKIPTEMRIQDKFLQFLRKYIKNSYITKLTFDSQKNLLLFHLCSQHNNIVWAFKYYQHKLYFCLNAPDEYFCSWEGLFIKRKVNTEDLFLSFESTSLIMEDKNDEDDPISLEYKLTKKLLEKSEKTVRKRQHNKKYKIKQDINRIEEFLNLEDQLKLNKLSFEGLDHFSYAGVKIKLGRHNSHYQNLDKIYKKIKSFKNGLKIQRNRFENIKEHKSTQVSSHPLDSSKIVQPAWSSRKQITRPNNSGPYHFDQFLLDSGLKVIVAKDARSNDYIRSHLASSHDLWVHLEGTQSSHAIIKVTDVVPTLDDFQITASIILDYSSSRTMQIAIIYTQVKNLKGVKGKAGLVRYQKQKHLLVNYEKNWKDRVKPI